MNAVKEEEEIVYEVAVVVPKRNLKEENEEYDCVEVLVNEFRNVGLVVDRVLGLSDEFIKLGAPLETLGRAAAKLGMKKPTHIDGSLTFLSALVKDTKYWEGNGAPCSLPWKL
ncbi:anoctamin-7-like protein [Corchorus olitorius]|uniref:Anoctamin-7-like protein n=1 Tax=Corchorus olitorius TaxID=93759 RepID=A0A1R3H7Q6_9ROSI|nr:anoctamin-7-like protein [Corchorus olitorius]